jgi:hypothetical protein
VTQPKLTTVDIDLLSGRETVIAGHPVLARFTQRLVVIQGGMTLERGEQELLGLHEGAGRGRLIAR